MSTFDLVSKIVAHQSKARQRKRKNISQKPPCVPVKKKKHIVDDKEDVRVYSIVISPLSLSLSPALSFPSILSVSVLFLFLPYYGTG